MKTIKKKIALPFITIILLIPIVTMILFNLVMNIYIDQTTKEELQNTITGIEILVKKQVLQGYFDRVIGSNNDAANENLSILRSTLRVSKLTSNTEFLLLSPRDILLFPRTFDDSFLNNDIFDQAMSHLTGTKEDELIEFRIGREKYFATYKTLNGRVRALKLVFISSGNASNIIDTTNLVLLGITVLAVGMGIVIAIKISKSISTPITKLSAYAKKIGSGEFISLVEENSSLELHQLTESMNEMSQRLKNYDHTQKAFLQNASHELRTPLMSIQGYAEGISKGIFTDTVKAADIIREESLRLNKLVEELLTLSRIDNQTYQGELITVNLSDIIKEYVQRIEGYALKEGKNINLDIRENPLAVKINDSLLLQAVINIISNCIKYAKSTVKVVVFSQNTHAVIRIIDDGRGIAETDLPHIFERFYKGKKGSFGLGLSIAKSAVEYMGGSIIAYNEGTGAVFEINLSLYP